MDRGVPRRAAVRAVGLAMAMTVAACGGSGGPVTTPPVVAGRSDAPREVNLIAKDFSFLPDVLDLVPGETVLLHVVNGGLVVHEAVIGDMTVQDAWEAAEAAAPAGPGPTPVVTVPPHVAGIRIVVESGQRADLVWTVPDDVAAPGAPAWIVGCHIPGHWAAGMRIPVRWTGSGGASPDGASPDGGPAGT